MHREVRFLPCSPGCANWLRFGVQPDGAVPGMEPGRCDGKAHDIENLGLGGRRVLVSRKWSGKTLKQHKADRAEVVRAALEEAGITPPEARRCAAEVLASDGKPRFVWEDVEASPLRYAAVIVAAVDERRRWRTEYAHAKTLLPNPPPPHSDSLTSLPLKRTTS